MKKELYIKWKNHAKSIPYSKNTIENKRLQENDVKKKITILILIPLKLRKWAIEKRKLDKIIIILKLSEVFDESRLNK
jgi:hypothetical protein